jgi:hypothetical protein
LALQVDLTLLSIQEPGVRSNQPSNNLIV